MVEQRPFIAHLRYKVQLMEAIDIRVGNNLFFKKKGGRPNQVYCVKCGVKREMKDAKAITMKNAKQATHKTDAVASY